MPPKIIRMMIGGIVLAAVAGFAVLYWIEIVRVCGWDSSKAFVSRPEPYIYIATALAGLVGGVAAMVFNEKLPEDPNGGSSTTRTMGSGKRVEPVSSLSGFSKAKVALQAIAQPLQPKKGPLPDAFVVISSIYVIVYFVTGVAAIATWVGRSNIDSSLVKNLALISFGLFIAIARSFFKLPKA
jgi:hypothetical protein